jgi:hypothetical protein
MDSLDAKEGKEQKEWAGIELLACAILQLVLVNVAYRIDRQKAAPLISTSSWAIFLGLVVSFRCNMLTI